MDSEPQEGASAADARFRRLFPMMVLSCASVLGFVVVLGFVEPDRWNGSYLIWGIAIGLVGAANELVAVRLLPRLADATKEQAESFRSRSSWRRNTVMMSMITFGIVTGAISAILDSAVVVIVYTVAVLLTIGGNYTMAVLVARPALKRQRRLDE